MLWLNLWYHDPLMLSSFQCLSPPWQGDVWLWKATMAFSTWALHFQHHQQRSLLENLNADQIWCVFSSRSAHETLWKGHSQPSHSEGLKLPHLSAVHLPDEQHLLPEQGNWCNWDPSLWKRIAQSVGTCIVMSRMVHFSRHLKMAAFVKIAVLHSASWNSDNLCNQPFQHDQITQGELEFTGKVGQLPGGGWCTLVKPPPQHCGVEIPQVFPCNTS